MGTLEAWKIELEDLIRLIIKFALNYDEVGFEIFKLKDTIRDPFETIQNRLYALIEGTFFYLIDDVWTPNTFVRKVQRSLFTESI